MLFLKVDPDVSRGWPFYAFIFRKQITMAKGSKREYVWLECKECSSRNYRTQVNVSEGTPKIELSKFCSKERKHTVHKIRRK